MNMRPWIALSLAGLVGSAGCHRPPSPCLAGDGYAENIAVFREKRLQRLQADEGWLQLSGLFWLKPGPNRIGSNPENDIRLGDRAPAEIGVLTLSADDTAAARLSVAADVQATLNGALLREKVLVSDGDGRLEPDRVKVGDFTLLVIERGGRQALRLYDRQAPTFTGFRGLEHFPLSQRHRICARFSAYPVPRTIAVGTAIGTSEEAKIPGEVEFELDGVSLSLLPIAEEDGLFFVFADTTNGATTYGGGRFLMANPPDQNGEVVLDFNRAENPPCAFTPYATCPRPPRENRLPIAIEAGEKAYSREH